MKTHCGNENIKQTKYVTFLGVLVDEHLTWKYHINERNKKLSRATGIFFKLRQYVPLQTLIRLYISLFASFLNYGILVWGLTYDTYSDQLFIVQEKVLRCIACQPFTAPTTPLFHSLKLVKLQHILQFSTLTFVYKAINRLSPACFHSYFIPNSSFHLFETRQPTRGDLFLSFKRTTSYGQRTVQHCGSQLWNALPFSIRIEGSLSAFRSELKAHYIHSYV